ncbi:hypothetical protein FRC19_000979, partial [Serendipita sp. 401]
RGGIKLWKNDLLILSDAHSVISNKYVIDSSCGCIFYSLYMVFTLISSSSDSFGVISIPLASYLSLWRHIYSFIFPSWSPPSSIRKRYETFPKNQSQSLVDSSPVAKARRVHNGM